MNLILKILVFMSMAVAAIATTSKDPNCAQLEPGEVKTELCGSSEAQEEQRSELLSQAGVDLEALKTRVELRPIIFGLMSDAAYPPYSYFRCQLKVTSHESPDENVSTVFADVMCKEKLSSKSLIRYARVIFDDINYPEVKASDLKLRAVSVSPLY